MSWNEITWRWEQHTSLSLLIMIEMAETGDVEQRKEMNTLMEVGLSQPSKATEDSALNVVAPGSLYRGFDRNQFPAMNILISTYSFRGVHMPVNTEVNTGGSVEKGEIKNIL